MSERNKPVHFYMTEDEKEELETLADSQGRSHASLLRWLVRKEAKRAMEGNGN